MGEVTQRRQPDRRELPGKALQLEVPNDLRKCTMFIDA
jgi:hypothetical protein